MAMLTLQNLGRMIAQKRGEKGVRAAAQEIGISAATLSRVERGNLPDLQTFSKICEWLEVDPGEVLGTKTAKAEKPPISVHFKKEATISESTAQALAKMVLAAQRAMAYMNERGGK